MLFYMLYVTLKPEVRYYQFLPVQTRNPKVQ
jgi:hypothetical protein